MKEPKKYSILVVDDLARNIQVVASFLTKEGYQIFFARDGESAIKEATSRELDLILLDVMMPGMNGFEVCRHLINEVKDFNVPIIFLTAKADDTAIEEGFKSGGVDYVTKPFNSRELLARVRHHIQLREKELELRDLNKTKDTLLAIIGHDLKTPISNIITLGQILTENYAEYDREQVFEFISDLIGSAKLSFDLLENLLSWTRVQTGKMVYRPEDLEFDFFVDQSLAFIQQNATSKGISIIKTIEPGLHLYADPNVTNTILRNLLSNAVKFTKKGGEVLVKAQKVERSIVIEVADNGVGMKPERVKNLFNAGGNVSTAGTENEAGTGLGLVLTSELVHLQKGSIGVKSKVGVGTSFTLVFPVK